MMNLRASDKVGTDDVEAGENSTALQRQRDQGIQKSTRSQPAFPAMHLILNILLILNVLLPIIGYITWSVKDSERDEYVKDGLLTGWNKYLHHFNCSDSKVQPDTTCANATSLPNLFPKSSESGSSTVNCCHSTCNLLTVASLNPNDTNKQSECSTSMFFYMFPSLMYLLIQVLRRVFGTQEVGSTGFYGKETGCEQCGRTVVGKEFWKCSKNSNLSEAESTGAAGTAANVNGNEPASTSRSNANRSNANCCSGCLGVSAIAFYLFIIIVYGYNSSSPLNADGMWDGWDCRDSPNGGQVDRFLSCYGVNGQAPNFTDPLPATGLPVSDANFRQLYEAVDTDLTFNQTFGPLLGVVMYINFFAMVVVNLLEVLFVCGVGK